jgi:hypothetical protein
MHVHTSLQKKTLPCGEFISNGTRSYFLEEHPVLQSTRIMTDTIPILGFRGGSPLVSILLYDECVTSMCAMLPTFRRYMLSPCFGTCLWHLRRMHLSLSTVPVRKARTPTPPHLSASCSRVGSKTKVYMNRTL